MRTSTLRAALALLCAAAPLHAQAPPKIKAERVTNRVQWLQTPLANVTMLIGPDGLLVVDSGQPQDAAALASMITTLTPKPVRILVNTHYHFDHTGGNAVIGKGALIVAQENCRATMLKDLKPGQKPEDAGVPKEEFGTERGIRFGEDIVRLQHFGSGHTAGDTVVVMEDEKLVVAGDLFFNGMPPYIDVANGSDTENWIRTIQVMAQRYPKFKVMPGHGALSNMKGWLRFADYLGALRKKVAAAIEAGKTKEQAVAEIKLDEFPEVKDIPNSLTKAQNVGWVYDEMKRAK